MPIGPSTTTAPYLLAVEPNVRFTSIATVGNVLDTNDNGTPYRMVGIPDGLGAFDNGNGTFTLLMNHELGATQGIVRAHGATGAFVSQWVIDKTTLQVLDVKDSISTIKLWDDATGSFVTSTYAIGRLCSADLAEQSAYSFTAPDGTVYGTQDRIFMTGEESGAEGKEFGLVVTGSEAGTAYELAYTGLFSWENAVSSSYSQLKTINVGTDDSTGGQVYIYIGEKQTTGNAVEKAGLMYGDLFGLTVSGITAEANGTIANGSFTLTKLGADEDGNGTPDGDVSKMTGAALEAQSNSLGVTKFLRPEDVHFDPTNPNVFYFVTTNGFNAPSRLYKATFTDITNPEAGGTIVAVLDGTEGQQMLDNITVGADGKLILQEDPGNQSYIAKVWSYDPATDVLTPIAQHDPALFVTGSPTFKTQDEESSGVIDVTAMLGDADTKAYLLDVQSHLNLPDPELVQDGQLVAMFIDAVETKGTNAANTLNGSAADEKFNALGGNDVINAGSGNDELIGGAGNDTLNAGAGNDVLRGLADNDTLLGGAGDDNLDGGAGDDVINGGIGFDILRGGAGADSFVFKAGDSSFAKLDKIMDFNSLQGDKIDLTAFGVTSADLAINQVNQLSYVVGLDLDHDGGYEFGITIISKTAISSADFLF
ncbi:MAG: alkaline phosphatase PhoX [Novosphingobium sp.]